MSTADSPNIACQDHRSVTRLETGRAKSAPSELVSLRRSGYRGGAAASDRPTSGERDSLTVEEIALRTG
jgi:hypothetical protein